MAIQLHLRPAPVPDVSAGPPEDAPILVWIEQVLFVVGVFLLAYFAIVNVETALYQAYEDRELDAILRSRSSASSHDTRAAAPAASAGVPAVPVRRPRHLPTGSIIGRVEIPRLKVSSVVRAGSDARTLRLAVGHIPGTSLPGEQGNVGLAGHRDTFFRRLRDVRPNDEIRIAGPDGTYVYRVARTSIVEPSDVWVLDPTPQPSLTLVTCYPFSYVGSAPQRFIVHADLISAANTQ
jgi:sortase A